MATFGNKILGLTAAAMTFAGMAFGQATCASATASPNFIRAEGTTELVGTITVTCSSLTAGPLSMQIYLSPSLTITSKLLSTSTGRRKRPQSLVPRPVHLLSVPSAETARLTLPSELLQLLRRPQRFRSPIFVSTLRR